MIGDKVKYGHLDDKISDLRVSIDVTKIDSFTLFIGCSF